MRIGILAYGSLIDDPGFEMKPRIVERIGVKTPFRIEFARQSGERDNAPTLTVVTQGGAHADGVVLLLDETVTEKQAVDMLYRREIGAVGSGRSYRQNDVVIELFDMEEIGRILYARLKQNIPNPSPLGLARLAIASASREAGAERRDGISYLISAKKNGIRTPLMEEYEKKILLETETETLVDAWETVRSGVAGSDF